MAIVFNQDKARPQTSLLTRKKVEELCWDVMMNPPDSPSLAVSDYHLFRLMENQARPHTYLLIRQKLEVLCWEVLMHPPYRPVCTIGLPFFSVIAVLPEWSKVGFKRSL